MGWVSTASSWLWGKLSKRIQNCWCKEREREGRRERRRRGRKERREVKERERIRGEKGREERGKEMKGERREGEGKGGRRYNKINLRLTLQFPNFDSEFWLCKIPPLGEANQRIQRTLSKTSATSFALQNYFGTKHCLFLWSYQQSARPCSTKTANMCLLSTGGGGDLHVTPRESLGTAKDVSWLIRCKSVSISKFKETDFGDHI